MLQGAYDNGRAGDDGRRQVHFAAAGCLAFSFQQVRPDKASQLQVHRRCRQEKRL